MKVVRFFTFFLVVFLGILYLTPSAYSIKVIVEDYSDPKDAVKWEAVPGENYVVHVYNNDSSGIIKEVYFFDNNKLEVTNACRLLSGLTSQNNIMVRCGYGTVSVLVFKDSNITKSELLNIISRANVDVDVSIFLVPYKSQEVNIIEKYLYKDGFSRKIWDELHSVFGENKSKGLISIGNGLFEGGIIAIYAPYFSDEDITLIFKTVRKYIPEDVRFTIIAFHYIPKLEPDIQILEPESGEQNPQPYLNILLITATLSVAVTMALYLRGKSKL